MSVVRGDGVVLAIKPDGDLLWYRYTGDGTTTRWQINSGNTIGNGWQDFKQVVGGLYPRLAEITEPLPDVTWLNFGEAMTILHNLGYQTSHRLEPA
jgi:hypothetical protein